MRAHLALGLPAIVLVRLFLDIGRTERDVDVLLDTRTLVVFEIDAARQAHEILDATWRANSAARTDIAAERAALRRVNEALWDIEDRIRLKEKAKAFDAEFIELARSVYIRNDERARVKRAINEKLGSALVEEKSYQDYH